MGKLSMKCLWWTLRKKPACTVRSTKENEPEAPCRRRMCALLCSSASLSYLPVCVEVYTLNLIGIFTRQQIFWCSYLTYLKKLNILESRLNKSDRFREIKRQLITSQMFLHSVSKVGTVFIGKHCIFNKSLTKRLWALDRLCSKLFLKLLPARALSKLAFALSLWGHCKSVSQLLEENTVKDLGNTGFDFFTKYDTQSLSNKEK